MEPNTSGTLTEPMIPSIPKESVKPATLKNKTIEELNQDLAHIFAGLINVGVGLADALDQDLGYSEDKVKQFMEYFPEFALKTSMVLRLSEISRNYIAMIEDKSVAEKQQNSTELTENNGS